MYSTWGLFIPKSNFVALLFVEIKYQHNVWNCHQSPPPAPSLPYRCNIAIIFVRCSSDFHIMLYDLPKAFCLMHFNNVHVFSSHFLIMSPLPFLLIYSVKLIH